MKILSVLMVFTGVGTIGWAQTAINVAPETTGAVKVFSGASDIKSAPVDPLTLKPNTSTNIVPGAGETKMYAWDPTSGNLASVDVAKAKTDWKPKVSDFSEVAEVAISVESGGKPVSAASVELKDPHRSQTQLVDPSAKGKVTFFDIAPGSLQVKVTYRSGGTGSKTITQLFDLALKRTETVPTFRVAIADPVDTVGPTAPAPAAGTAGAAPAAANAPAPARSAIGSLIVYLLGLAAAGGAAYFAMKYAKQNPDKVGTTLEQLGVQIPKPGDAALVDPGPLPPAPAAPAPPQKIMLGDAAPDPISVSPVAVAPAPISVSVSAPSLIDAAGVPITLAEGETIVGREIGVGLSLPGESSISRQHAKLTKVGGDITLVDLGSTNGTFVNGARLQGPTTLRRGDTVQFGSVQFRYEG